MTNVTPAAIDTSLQSFENRGFDIHADSAADISRGGDGRISPSLNGHYLQGGAIMPATSDGGYTKSVNDIFSVDRFSGPEVPGNGSLARPLANSRATLLTDNPEDSADSVSSPLFVRLDSDEEKLYRQYFRGQRVGLLPALVVLATANATVQVTLDLLSESPESRLARLLVIPGAAVTVWICSSIAMRSSRHTVIVLMEVAAWVALAFQILYDKGSSEPEQVPSDRVGLTLCLVYLSQMVLPCSTRGSLPVVTLLVLLHSLVAGITWARRESHSTQLTPQLLSNVLLCLASIAIGVSRSMFLDMMSRRSLLETKAALEAKGKIELAYKNKERLLLSVLPKHVADEMLKDVGNLAPDGQFRKIYMSRYENVSILFADIVGFTAISSSVTAAALVKILNELFARFDVLAEQFHQTRIKILGDCYYCVCGALEARPDHAVLTIHMGLSMVEAISSVRQKTGKEVNMRVGVHTGACLGGVLGQRQWQFDVLGKEVTLANKMESGGLPARVHISEITHQFLNGEFDLEDGHGGDREDELKLRNIRTYLVKGVNKPYPQGTLDMHNGTSKGTPHHAGKRDSAADKGKKKLENGDSKIGNAVGENVEDSSYKELTDTQQGVDKAKFVESLRRELAEMHRIRATSKFMTPCLWRFKDGNLEKKYSERFERYSGLPWFGVTVALLLVFCAKLCVFPRSPVWIAIHISGVALLLTTALFFLAESLPKSYPSCVVRFARTLRKSFSLEAFWVVFAWLIFFACDIMPVHFCDDAHLNETSTDDLDPESEGCEYIVYFSHGACVLMIAISATVNRDHLLKNATLLFLLAAHTLISLVVLEEFYHHYDVRVYTSANSDKKTRYRLLGELLAVVVTLVPYNMNAERIARTLFYWKEARQLQKEEAVKMQARNTALVYNLLPTHVAKEFSTARKSDSELYSQAYDEVGVIFAACPNFNSFYNESAVNNNGLECLRFLNEIISDYDELLNLSRFSSIVKIKTVGSTYMAASGMVESGSAQKQTDEPTGRWAHYKELVHFALAMQDVIRKINEQSFNNFILRIGINHGPVIAGVIGARKPHYDIWGNTVNVASRMESTGQAGRIQVVEESKELLHTFGFTFEKRGLITVKGKGQLMTYFLERKEAEALDGIPNQVPGS